MLEMTIMLYVSWSLTDKKSHLAPPKEEKKEKEVKIRKSIILKVEKKKDITTDYEA